MNDIYPTEDAWIEAHRDQDLQLEREYYDWLEKEYEQQQEEEYLQWLEEQENEQDGD